MNVRITLDLPATRLPDLAKWLEEPSSAAASGLSEAPVPVPETPAIVALSKPVETLPDPPITVTKTMIRARGLELTKAGESASLGEIFRKFGAEKLSDLKEENYEEAYRLMGELL